MAKDIVKDLQSIQDELKELRSFKKSVQKYIQKGSDFLEENPKKKASENEAEKLTEKASDFEAKICTYYDLKNEAEKQQWIEVMLNDHSKGFWEKHRQPAE